MSQETAITTPRTVIHSEPDFDVSIHGVQIGDKVITLLHLDVYYFSPATLRHMMRLWPSIRSKLPAIIMCQGDQDGPLFEKFVTRFGWQLMGDCICTDGRNRRLFAHLLRSK